MKEPAKRWIAFLIGVALAGSAGVGATYVSAQECTVQVTEEVLDAYCQGREPHTCPSPCPEAADVCPDPCPAPEPIAPPPPAEECKPAIEIVPARARIDWSLVADPELELAVLELRWRWRWKLQPVIAASWTEGRPGRAQVDAWSSNYYPMTNPTEDDWKVLVGVGGSL